MIARQLKGQQLALFDVDSPQLEIVSNPQPQSDEIARWKRAYIMRQIVTAYDKTYILGEAGEQLVITELECVDYVRSLWTGRKKRRVADIALTNRLTGEVSRLEVKTARRGKHGYQFSLRKNDKYGRTSIDDANFVLLQAITPAGAIYRYLLPVSALNEQTKITISNPETYAGIYAQYRIERDCMKLICQQIFGA